MLKTEKTQNTRGSRGTHSEWRAINIRAVSRFVREITVHDPISAGFYLVTGHHRSGKISIRYFKECSPR